MKYTDEQKKIIDKIQEDGISLLKVNSVAGSGKTSVLTGIARAIQPRRGIYLAYNKAIAKEAATKFPRGINCMTTHSMAYQNTVKAYNLTVGIFNWKSITEYMRYEIKLITIDIINDFCLSKYIKFDEFIDGEPGRREHLNHIDSKIIPIAKKYLTEMMNGTIDITHAGYLKMYHMLLANGQLKHQEFDLLMLDECGDINPVTLAIFKLLPSPKKVMVGDENQNIYTFNKTINGFEVMRDEGVQLNMTRSFRCKPEIAKRIEMFCQTYINPFMEFKGTEPEDEVIRTKAVISRTNSALVGEMIELLKMDTKFNLTRKASVIFELVLIMLNLKPGGKIFSKEWKFLQDDVEEWNTDARIGMEFDTPFKYIAAKYGEDPAIKTTIGIIAKYGGKDVYKAYDYAKKHEKEKNNPITLCTAHSSKGLEFDLVDITDDLNLSVERIVTGDTKPGEYNEKELETLRLYYVACSRATKKLRNAQWLAPIVNRI